MQQTAFLTSITNVFTIVVLYVCDRASDDTLINKYLLPLITYTLLSANLDF